MFHQQWHVVNGRGNISSKWCGRQSGHWNGAACRIVVVTTIIRAEVVVVGREIVVVVVAAIKNEGLSIDGMLVIVIVQV